MDVWCNSLCNDLESSNWNNHKKTGCLEFQGYVSDSKVVGVSKRPCGAQTLPTQELLHVDNRNLRVSVNFSNHRGKVVSFPLPKRKCRRNKVSVSVYNCVTFIYFFEKRQLCKHEPVSAVDCKKGNKKEQLCWNLIFTVNVCLRLTTMPQWAQLSQDTSCTVCHAAGPIILGILPTSATRTIGEQPFSSQW